MRGTWIVTTALLAGALLPGAARAGVYNTTGTLLPEFARPGDPDALEPWPMPGTYDTFRVNLARYRAAAVDVPNRAALAVWSVTTAAGPPWPGQPLGLLASLAAQGDLGPAEQSVGLHFARRVARLEAKERDGLLTLDDRINLGAYYVRLGNYRKAIRVMEGHGPRHFLLLANLATAYELGGIPERAVTYQSLALANWPATYPGWAGFQVNIYRKAEKYHLALMRLRQEEARLPAGRAGGLRLDPLFPKVEFVGPGGGYEAGGIAPAQWGEMPADATDLVMLLLLGTPFDERLHWLLGELLNAGGDVIGAEEVLRPLVNKQPDPAKWSSSAPPELREHYRVIAAAARAATAYRNEALTQPFLNLQLLCAVAPRGLGLGAGAADLAREAAWPATVVEFQDRTRRAQEVKRPPAADSPAAAAGDKPPAGWVPDWRQIAVSFAAGAAVSWLLAQQFRRGKRTQ